MKVSVWRLLQRWWIFGLVLLTLNGQVALACEVHTLDLAAGQMSSRWRERDAAGALLVSERGQLQQIQLGLEGACDLWRWRLETVRAQGSRHYQGRSNTGAGISSSSDVSATSASLVVLRPLNGAWSAGLRADTRQMDRTLQGVGSVLGYPETFMQHWLGGVVQYDHDTVAWGRWQWRASQSHDLSGQVRIHLPGMDPAVMPLGGSIGRAVELRWTGCRDGVLAGWQCSAKLAYQMERMAEGDAVPIYQNGRLKAAAHQPATFQQNTSLMLALTYPLR